MRPSTTAILFFGIIGTAGLIISMLMGMTKLAKTPIADRAKLVHDLEEKFRYPKLSITGVSGPMEFTLSYDAPAAAGPGPTWEQEVEARKLLARVRLQLNRPDAALQVLTPALGKDVADGQLYGLVGAAELRAGNTDKALTTLEENVRLHPTDEDSRINLAMGYMSVRRHRDAVRGTPAH